MFFTSSYPNNHAQVIGQSHKTWFWEFEEMSDWTFTCNNHAQVGIQCFNGNCIGVPIVFRKHHEVLVNNKNVLGSFKTSMTHNCILGSTVYFGLFLDKNQVSGYFGDNMFWKFIFMHDWKIIFSWCICS